MDIRNWPMNKIMQLPDCAFGRRWPVPVVFGKTSPGQVFYMSDAALPERCVLWELMIHTYTVVLETLVALKISLGDQLPASNAEFLALEPLFSTWDPKGTLTYGFPISGGSSFALRGLKMPVHSQGRKICVDANSGATDWDIILTLVFSSFPTEVPDWLCSGRV